MYLDTLITVNANDFFLPNRERDVYPLNLHNTQIFHSVRGREWFQR